jgi:hypothetical protein
MNDLLYIGLTIVIFLLLALLVKGVEHFERLQLARSDRRDSAHHLPDSGPD